MARLADENLIVTKTLLRRFELEGEFDDGDGRYYACILRSNNELLVHHPGAPALDAPQALFAGDVLKFLNRDLHHDGAWVLVFTHPMPVSMENALLYSNMHAEYARYCLMWLDEDGDVQFTSDWMAGTGELRTFTDVLEAGLESVAQAAEVSWQAWDEMMNQNLQRKVGVETFKRARGEEAPSTKTLQ